jgi:crotonobetainyl-CoA:carnitine CoA-transferase CaiB-like acyl-CoA transferase
VKVEHPELGNSLSYCGPFVKMSETPLKIKRRPPLIGEHNEEVYEEELHFRREELLFLKQSHVI